MNYVMGEIMLLNLGVMHDHIANSLVSQTFRARRERECLVTLVDIPCAPGIFNY